MNKPTNAADRWHPQLFTIKALVKLATDVAFDHMGSEHKKCRKDEEIAAAWNALCVVEEKLRQIIDELTEEGHLYRLAEKQPAA